MGKSGSGYFRFKHYFKFKLVNFNSKEIICSLNSDVS